MSSSSLRPIWVSPIWVLPILLVWFDPKTKKITHDIGTLNKPNSARILAIVMGSLNKMGEK